MEYKSGSFLEKICNLYLVFTFSTRDFKSYNLIRMLMFKKSTETFSFESCNMPFVYSVSAIYCFCKFIIFSHLLSIHSFPALGTVHFKKTTM